MDEMIFEEIKELIMETTAVRIKVWDNNIIIDRDLRITGADAIDFIVAFGKRFKVDVSNFMAADYFDAEGVGWFMPNYNPNKKKLTLGHLVKAVNAGRLDELVING